MTLRTLNWCTASKLDCDASIPTTAFLCVTPSIVETTGEDVPAGFIEATLTAVRASTCYDACGLCKWVYTIEYDDEQLVEGFILAVADISAILCGNNCLIAFILDQASCERVRECISVEDTESVDMTYDETTGIISSDVIINDDVSNALMSTPSGLLVTPGAISCEDVEICVGIDFCWNLAVTEAEVVALNTAGVGGIAVGASITLTAARAIDIPLTVLPCGLINTSGNVLTINDAFSAGSYTCFNAAATGEVLFRKGSVDAVLPEWFGAVSDGVVNCTNAINRAIGSTTGIVQLAAGVYLVTGIVITKTVTLQGDGWKTIIRNSSSVNHSISRIGGADVDTRAIKIADLAIEHTGGGVIVDGIHLQQVNNHIRIERVYVLEARRYGIYIEGDVDSFTGSLYTRIDQCWSEGNLTDGVFLNGGTNNATIIGGRFGGNSRYGLNVDDTITGDPASFPNTLRVFGTDLPGNSVAGLHEAGHSNAYYGIRFEGNVTQDILFATKSESAMFFGTSYSSTPVINGTPSARATMYDKDFFIRQFQDYGYLEYWDELDGAKRYAPKRSLYNITINKTTALESAADSRWGVARVLDRAKIFRVSVIPSMGIIGVNTNYASFQLRNNKFGGGDVAVATLSFTAGNDLVAITETEIPIVVGNDEVVDGDILYFDKTDTGLGAPTPCVCLQVEYGGY